MQTQTKSVHASAERVPHRGSGRLDAQIQAGGYAGRDGSEAIRDAGGRLTYSPPSSWIKMPPGFWGVLSSVGLDCLQVQVASNEGIIQSVILDHAQTCADKSKDGNLKKLGMLKAVFGHAKNDGTALGAYSTCRSREGGK